MTNPIKIVSKDEFLKKNKKSSQENIWESIAKAWNKYVVKKILVVEDFMKSKKGFVVDFGCGDGRNMIVNSKIKYYGIDFSSASLKHAEKRAKKEGLKVELFKSRVDSLDKKVFKNNMFDYGLFIATLHCLETRKQRLDALKEFYRVLKVGAQGLISVWNSEDKRFNRVRKLGCGDIYMSWLDNGEQYYRYYYLYFKKELLNLLKRVGFKVEEIYEPTLHDRFSKKNWIIRVRK